MRDAGALAKAREAFRRPLAGDKRTVARVDVAGQQLRRMGVGARYHQSLDAKQFIRTLNAARLAADVLGVETLVVARTDAHSAQLLTSDVDPRDRAFITGERTPEGVFRLRAGAGAEHAIAPGLAYAPYDDLLGWGTS